MPILSLIAAIDENRLLANEHRIPWHLPRDIAHFRHATRDKWLLLGRKTFEEMLGWFRPGHTPLVLSGQCGWDPPIGRLVSSVPHALALAESAGEETLVCVGGAQTFAAALPYADELVITTVHHRFAPGAQPVYFPAWDTEEWRKRREEHFAADAENAHDFTITVWHRQQPSHGG